jgi:ribosomal protein L13E
MRKIGLVLDMRREPPHQKIVETALFAVIENG